MSWRAVPSEDVGERLAVHGALELEGSGIQSLATGQSHMLLEHILRRIKPFSEKVKNSGSSVKPNIFLDLMLRRATPLSEDVKISDSSLTRGGALSVSGLAL